MAEKLIRPANRKDFPAIRKLIHEVGINPTGLNWHRFLVAEAEDGQVIGCGQIKSHRDGSRELASIAVSSLERGQGIAGRIIKHLLINIPRPVYLMCRASLGSFYNQYGFRAIMRDEMPPYFKRIVTIVSSFRAGPKNGLLVMRLDKGE